MNDKRQLLTMLKDEFDRWEELLGSMSERQLTAPQLAGDWSIKDMIAHLRAWQQRSIARLEAALAGREPEFPGWPPEAGGDSDEDTNKTNAWIYEMYREHPWPTVHRAWREGFLRFLQLAEEVPENDLLEPGRYQWLGGLPLSAVLEGSYRHHQEEHREPLLAWLQQHGQQTTSGGGK